MDRALLRSSWTCARCLRRQKLASTRPRRLLSVATTVVPSSDFPPSFVTHSSPSVRHDDKTLREIFDSKAFWRDFSQPSSAINGAVADQGLFRNRFLNHPGGFDTYAIHTISRAKILVEKVLAAKTRAQYQGVINDLDRVSDLLCRCIDLADFVRSTHPDRATRESGSRAYGRVFQYMNVLKTTTGLNEQLRIALEDPDISKVFTEEERKVGEILLRDFSKSAVTLSDSEKQKFVEQSDKIVEYGTNFVNSRSPATTQIRFSPKALKGMDPLIVKQHTSWGSTILSTDSSMAATVLNTVQDESVRREIYLASRQAPDEQIRCLEEMLKARGSIAEMGGFKSYAHMTLSEKMAKSPEAVNEFLMALRAHNSPGVELEIEELTKLKQRRQPDSRLEVWDRDYYSRMLAAQERSKVQRSDPLKAYFSIGTVMQGLSRIFHRLYGVRLVPQKLLPGETWNSDVRRLDVVDEFDKLVAVLYCDLFERDGKHTNPSHFTIRCSRHIAEDEIAELNTVSFLTPEEVANDGMATSRNSKGELFQLPTIALICDFEREFSTQPSLLSFGEVETLFHEMGHAIHSMLGRTYFQNVSGTRCVTDFAELPSILMENFISSPEALALFARHYKTDEPLPFEMVEARVKRDKLFENGHIESQILLSLLDQAYHSRAALQPNFDTTAILHQIFGQYSVLKEPKGTSRQGFFQHLFGYGATYYSYLFDRAIADKVWREVFSRMPGGAVDRKAGEVFKSEVLQWGGARDPWKCLAGALKIPSLAEGDENAMREVGRWGVGKLK